MKLNPIFYDTETTGLRADKDRIIEIAAYDPSTDRSFVKLVNPGVPIPKEATNIHHISDDMVKDAPEISSVLNEFVSFCGTNTILIAHNNDAFDVLFLQQEFLRSSLEIPKDWRFLDSLKWARRYRPDLPRHTLQFLREIYGFQANNAHRALDDVIILHRVFQAMTDDLSIEQVIDLLNAPKTIKIMPFGKHQGKPLSQLPKDYVAWLAGSGAFDKPENIPLKDAFSALGILANT